MQQLLLKMLLRKSRTLSTINLRNQRTANAVRFFACCCIYRLILLFFCASIQNIENRVDISENVWYNIKAVKDSSKIVRGVAQFGRVLGLGPRCRRFESCRLDQLPQKINRKNFLKKFQKRG